MKQRIRIKGELFSGAGRGAYFTQLSWVKEQMREKAGFEPFPGTVNLKVGEREFELLREEGRKGTPLPPPSPDFCLSRIVKVKLQDVPAAVIFPAEEVWIHKNALEVVAPVRVKEAFGVRDGDLLTLELERSFEPKGVVFDLDGTLIDSIEVYVADINEIFRRVGLPPVSREEVVRCMRLHLNPWDEFIPKDLPQRDAVVERCRALDKELWVEIYKQKADLFPGTSDLLRLLREKGLKLGVVTYGWEERGEIRELLQRRGVLELFDAVLTRFDVPRSKPAPDPILACCEKLGVRPWEAVCVGDGPNDIKAGKAALSATVGVLTGVSAREELEREEPDALIRTLEELPRVLWE